MTNSIHLALIPILRYLVNFGILAVVFLSASIAKQQNPAIFATGGHYWVFFADKPVIYKNCLSTGQFDTESTAEWRKTIALSAEAIAKRQLKGIPLDEMDIPVEQSYLELIRRSGLEILFTSRWLNAACVKANQSPVWLLESFSFVKAVCPATAYQKAMSKQPFVYPEDTFIDGWKKGIDNIREGLYSLNNASLSEKNRYGSALFQLEAIDAIRLHQLGWTGKGVLVGVMDAGYKSMDTLRAFEPLRKRKGIKQVRDFVRPTNDIYTEDEHGMHCMSVLASQWPGKLIGVAYDADYILVRTENAYGEYKVEEENWVRGIEWLDSLGVDVVSSSLNYHKFDDEIGNYTHADLTGDRAIITRAADIAAKKGIVVVNSAGNDGDKPWRKIIPPCDADSILCVGSINRGMTLSNFSSRGPTADGRIKPDVLAVGEASAVVSPYGWVTYNRGTSFACPAIAGLVACLLEACPGASVMEVIRSVHESGDRYFRPDGNYGYGLAKGDIALKRLQQRCYGGRLFFKPVIEISEGFLKVQLIDLENSSGELSVSILDNLGNIIADFPELPVEKTHLLPIGDLTPGKYLLRGTWSLGMIDMPLILR